MTAVVVFTCVWLGGGALLVWTGSSQLWARLHEREEAARVVAVDAPFVRLVTRDDRAVQVQLVRGAPVAGTRVSIEYRGDDPVAISERETGRRYGTPADRSVATPILELAFGALLLSPFLVGLAVRLSPWVRTRVEARMRRLAARIDADASDE